jgi:transposase
VATACKDWQAREGDSDLMEWTHSDLTGQLSSVAVRGGTSMKITTIGLDIAKQVFQIHAADAEGRVVLRKRLRRNQLAAFFANLPPCVVGLEACCGAHYWSRVFSRFGHTIRLIAPQFVKP